MYMILFGIYFIALSSAQQYKLLNVRLRNNHPIQHGYVVTKILIGEQSGNDHLTFAGDSGAGYLYDFDLAYLGNDCASITGTQLTFFTSTSPTYQGTVLNKNHTEITINMICDGKPKFQLDEKYRHMDISYWCCEPGKNCGEYDDLKCAN